MPILISECPVRPFHKYFSISSQSDVKHQQKKVLKGGGLSHSSEILWPASYRCGQERGGPVQMWGIVTG